MYKVDKSRKESVEGNRKRLRRNNCVKNPIRTHVKNVNTGRNILCVTIDTEV